MFPEIILKSGHAVEYELRCVEAYCAVRTVYYVLCGEFDLPEGIHSGFSVQDLLKQGGELSETDAARRALAAGLGVAQVKEAQGDVDRTQAGGACRDTALHACIHAVHQLLSLTFRSDAESAHDLSFSIDFGV